MALLNSAYDTLSDPEKRREYDRWIEALESRSLRGRTEKRSGKPDWITAPAGEGGSVRSSRPVGRFRHYWLLYVLALAAIFLGSLWYERLYLHRSKALTPLASAMSAARDEPAPAKEPSLFARPPAPESRPTEQPEPAAPPVQTGRQAASPRAAAQPAPTAHAAAKPATPDAAAPASEAPKHTPDPAPPRVRKKMVEPPAADTAPPGEAYSRPARAPNGEPWPSVSDYVGGYQQRNTNGLSQVIIDNSKNASDAFVKIVSVSDAEPKVVRNIFIQAADRFTATNLKAGSYELRYQNLDSGTLIRSETFALEESAIASGTRYSTVTLTLHAQPDESMNTFALNPGEF